ncbi:MAG: flagellar basal body-associated FliL family protein [Hyphomicrobiales bacterium]|nr:flagellar basal body-associated FliL family protein [Hyphomicrobiales bacterium]
MDENEEASADESNPDEDEAAGKKSKRRRLLLFAAIAVVCLAGAGAGAYFAGLLGGDAGHEAAEGAEGEDGHGAKETAAVKQTVFHALPEMLVTINADEYRSMFLKVRITIELTSNEDIAVIDQMMPRIIDYCQIYLRELRPEDLASSAGTVRLREELLRRISAAVAPTSVRDVLFSELLLQ